jgi:Ran GTPase-activating protein (RanGAP) involved in mRNA processing and transport
MHVVAKILKNSLSFAHVDLSKNFFTNQGLKVIGETLKLYNTTVIHLNLGGNHISADGAAYLFQCLENHPSMVSLDLANNDCYKNKMKIGVKGAQALLSMLSAPNCLIAHLDLTDNALTSEALLNIMEGVKNCKSIVTLNLTQNDLGSNG